MRYFFILLSLLALPAHAILIEEKLPTPQGEERAQELFKEIRCVVCAGESIHDSRADLARDLRRLVRERITAGDDDKAVLAYIEARYGESIRMTPPFHGSTYLLWLGPIIFLLMGGIVIWRVTHKR